MEEQPNLNNDKSPELNNESGKKERAIKHRKRQKGMTWPLIVFIITILLSFAFSFGSEFLLSDSGIVISIILLFFFLALATVSDMIGVAVTSAELEPFNSMSAKKIKGAKESVKLIKNADKVASIFCDIVGDICGILSGAVGASLTLQIIAGKMVGIKAVLIASFVSAVVAGLTVFLKSLGKRIAIKKSHNIIWTLGKAIKTFKFWQK